MDFFAACGRKMFAFAAKHIDLYFSHPDWYDADFRLYSFHPLQVPSSNILMTDYREAGRRLGGKEAIVMDPSSEGAGWGVRNLIDSVAKGGNFMVGIVPDADGQFHPAAVSQLKEVGKWLNMNGRAIYSTRARERDRWSEGSAIRLLGTDAPLPWTFTGATVQVQIPPGLQDESRRPCRFAWTFQIQTENV